MSCRRPSERGELGVITAADGNEAMQIYALEASSIKLVHYNPRM